MLPLNKKLRELIGKRILAIEKTLRKLLHFGRKNTVGASTAAVIYFSRRKDGNNNSNNVGIVVNSAPGNLLNLNKNDNSPRLPRQPTIYNQDPLASPMVVKIITMAGINQPAVPSPAGENMP
jgi:hypothetical protein